MISEPPWFLFITHILSAMGALIAAIAAIIGIFHITTLKVEINHRMDQLLKLADLAGFTRGKADRDKTSE
jgi:hypothetical protein